MNPIQYVLLFVIIIAHLSHAHMRLLQLEIMCPRKASLRSAKQYRDELKVCVYPGMDNPNAVTITNADLERLRPNELLNDTIIDFYLMYALTLIRFLVYCSLHCVLNFVGIYAKI